MCVPGAQAQAHAQAHAHTHTSRSNETWLFNIPLAAPVGSSMHYKPSFEWYGHHVDLMRTLQPGSTVPLLTLSQQIFLLAKN